jgi:hypothetical protein
MSDFCCKGSLRYSKDKNEGDEINSNVEQILSVTKRPFSIFVDATVILILEKLPRSSIIHLTSLELTIPAPV